MLSETNTKWAGTGWDILQTIPLRGIIFCDFNRTAWGLPCSPCFQPKNSGVKHIHTAMKQPYGNSSSRSETWSLLPNDSSFHTQSSPTPETTAIHLFSHKSSYFRCFWQGESYCICYSSETALSQFPTMYSVFTFLFYSCVILHLLYTYICIYSKNNMLLVHLPVGGCLIYVMPMANSAVMNMCLQMSPHDQLLVLLEHTPSLSKRDSRVLIFWRTVTLLSPRAVSPHLCTLSSQSRLRSGFALLEPFAVAVLMGVR